MPWVAGGEADPRSLTEEHLGYLTSPETLLAHKYDSLRKRVIGFEKKFPGKKISISRLRKLYFERGISKRILRVTVSLTAR